jgi:basic amino acid/polyamine antiporter, APA family
MTAPLIETDVASSHPASLGVWDAISLIVGIVVGVAIFKAPPMIFSLIESPLLGLLLWVLGAVLALCGALCYAELATAYPRFGGEYVFLTEAYGRRIGFLFAWMHLCATLTGCIGAMAFVFADYAAHLVPLFQDVPALAGGAAVCCLAGLHLRGIRTGKLVQNLLSLGKVLSLGLILLAGLLFTSGEATFESVPTEEPMTFSGLGLALVFVLYAYGGWNDTAAVTPEVRDHQKNMPRALLCGLGGIGLLYVALNLSYLHILGMEGLRASQVPAAEVVDRTFGRAGSVIMSLIVMVSALGAIHGMLFAGCRTLLAVGRDYPWFRAWSRWSPQGVPVFSLLTLMGVALTLILLVGTSTGQGLVTRGVSWLGLSPPRWERYGGGFSTLVAATAPIFWSFISLSSLSVIVLRFRDPGRPRPFRTPAYPFPALLFFAMALFMLWSSATYAGRLTLFLLPAGLVGIVLTLVQPYDGANRGSDRL